MTTHAYGESCLNDAKARLSQLFDCLINDCGMKPDWVASIFLASGYADLKLLPMEAIRHFYRSSTIKQKPQGVDPCGFSAV